MRRSRNLSNKTFSIRRLNSIGKCKGKKFFILRNRRKKITLKDFEPLSIIGRGAFGEVRICKFKETGEIVAMKKMKKQEMLFKN